mmetsp:Transcript_8763/g.13902  ORF Transcript_8763/g.13902 Transcript_8763/m.13902 type:complete len:224 (-) Transcript_8763:503-1174(-)
MWALASHPFVVQMMEASLGTGVQLYASQLHRKPPLDGGTVVPMHQDGDSKVRTLWIALDRVDQQNGGLQVLKGWHKHGRLPYKKISTVEELKLAEYFASHNVFAADLEPLRPANSQFEDRLDEQNRRPVNFQQDLCRYRLRSGGAGMHHPYIPHASPRNDSNRDRRVIILRFMAKDSNPEPAWIQHWKGGRWFEKEVHTVGAGVAPPTPSKMYEFPPKDLESS